MFGFSTYTARSNMSSTAPNAVPNVFLIPPCKLLLPLCLLLLSHSLCLSGIRVRPPCFTASHTNWPRSSPSSRLPRFPLQSSSHSDILSPSSALICDAQIDAETLNDNSEPETEISDSSKHKDLCSRYEWYCMSHKKFSPEFVHYNILRVCKISELEEFYNAYVSSHKDELHGKSDFESTFYVKVMGYIKDSECNIYDKATLHVNDNSTTKNLMVDIKSKFQEFMPIANTTGAVVTAVGTLGPRNKNKDDDSVLDFILNIYPGKENYSLTLHLNDQA